ncbi:hypothetical protein GGS21DRAFT_511329 [Xylaria nigripes]|nr:hypothetical protein GGS21DRAFT_511329 [Xylaria nigripes]
MPRPSRARPAPPTRLAKATKPSKITTAPAPELESQDNAASSDIYDVSDREKERAAARRKSLRDSKSTSNHATETMQQQRSLDIAKQRRNAAMERLANITSTDSTDEEPVGADRDGDGPPGPKPHIEATPLRRRPADMSGLDLDDSMFDDLNTTLDTVGHGSAQRSADTSIMSVSQFRRRPRAGSFLSRDDGPIRPGSRAGVNTPAFGSTLNFGVFKRRAREPSILSTTRKPRSQRLEPEEEEDDEDEEDEDEDEVDELDEGGFAPEAESTPLRRSKRMSGRVEPAQKTSSAKSRKRKSTENHERNVRSSPFKGNDDIRDSIEQPASDEDSPLSSPPALSEHRPSTPIMAPMDPELMAPPLSSGSSEGDEELWPPLRAIPKTRARQPTSVLRQTPGQDDVLNMSSPPSLTHSPNYAHSSSPLPAPAAKPKRKAAPKPPPKLRTAELTGLLPRRRRRDNDDSLPNMEDDSEPEVDTSGLRDGEDELAHLDVRTRQRPAQRANSQNQSTAKARASARNNKPTLGPNKRISRTYGKLSDKENQDEDIEMEGNESSNIVADVGEEDSEMVAERMGEELKNAVRKFEEVDKWELSFEERARSSSPLNAR